MLCCGVLATMTGGLSPRELGQDVPEGTVPRPHTCTCHCVRRQPRGTDPCARAAAAAAVQAGPVLVPGLQMGRLQKWSRHPGQSQVHPQHPTLSAVALSRNHSSCEGTSAALGWCPLLEIPGVALEEARAGQGRPSHMAWPSRHHCTASHRAASSRPCLSVRQAQLHLPDRGWEPPGGTRTLSSQPPSQPSL